MRYLCPFKSKELHPNKLAIGRDRRWGIFAHLIHDIGMIAPLSHSIRDPDGISALIADILINIELYEMIIRSMMSGYNWTTFPNII
jgi:hypothetical protein